MMRRETARRGSAGICRDGRHVRPGLAAFAVIPLLAACAPQGASTAAPAAPGAVKAAPAASVTAAPRSGVYFDVSEFFGKP